VPEAFEPGQYQLTALWGVLPDTVSCEGAASCTVSASFAKTIDVTIAQ